MKRNLCLALLLISSLGFAQRFAEVVLWQVETRAEGLVFGISKSKANAKTVMMDFQKRNAGSKYDIGAFDPVYKYTTIPIKTRRENPVKKFKSLAKKPYKVLSKEDMESLEIVRAEGLEAGVNYYMKYRDADEKFVISRLRDLVTNFEQFRIDEPDRYMVYSK